MTHAIKLCSLCLLILLLFTPAIHAEETIKAAVIKDFAPQYLTIDGKPSGFAIDVLDEVARIAGLKIEYQQYENWAATHQAIKEGNALIVPNAGITEKRKNLYDFTSPIETFPVSIFVRSSNTSIINLNDLVGFKVGLVESNIGTRLMQGRKNTEQKIYKHLNDALFALLSGEVDAIIYPKTVVEYHANQIGVLDKIKHTGVFLREIKRGIAIKKGHDALKAKLEKATLQFLKSPQYQEIYTRWHASPAPYWNTTRVISLFTALVLTMIGIGAIIHYFSIKRINTELRKNIEEKNKTEKNLIKAKEAAEVANRAKSSFISMMSHEIRTPMNGVIGMTQLLKDTVLTNEQKDYVATINSSGTNLLSIINNILDYSKLEANMVQTESIAFDLERACQECMRLVAGDARDKKYEFILDYEPDCPRYFLGDPSRIRQVLINLIGNASKFTKDGYIRCGVSCQSLDKRSCQLEIQIEDTGIGMDSDIQESLFDEFTQADSSTTRNYGGTGLGLAITRKLVNLMKAELSLISTPGKGSIFIIKLNLPTTQTPKPIMQSSLENKAVLFIDSQTNNCQIYKRLLNHMKMDVSIESNPQNTIERMKIANDQRKPFKIVILDDVMNNLKGLDIGKSIRQQIQFDNTKLLMLTSNGKKGEAQLYANAGFDAYLNKLTRYEILQAVLATMLNHQHDDPLITEHLIEESSSAATEKAFQSNARILLVEDVLPNQIIARKFLSAMGVEVDIADNGEEAIKRTQVTSYDLIFMDCRMPVMDGYEATRAIRQEEKEKQLKPIPIIALTANATTEDRELCRESGMDDVVTKPFKRSDLSQCLQKWLTVEVQ